MNMHNEESVERTRKTTATHSVQKKREENN